MPNSTVPTDLRPFARIAGLLYLVIIAAGITAEFVIRQPLRLASDDAAAAALRAAEGLYRAGFALDAVMVAADVALAAMLYLLLRSFGPALALLAMLFRLMQAAVLAVTLIVHHAALTLALGGAAGSLFALDLQAAAYDAGLIFFGINSVLMAVLLWRAHAPRALPVLVGLSGAVYLAGSFVRFLAPSLLQAVQPAYVVPLVAELWLALWLLHLGLRRPRTAAEISDGRATSA